MMFAGTDTLPGRVNVTVAFVKSAPLRVKDQRGYTSWYGVKPLGGQAMYPSRGVTVVPVPAPRNCACAGEWPAVPGTEPVPISRSDGMSMLRRWPVNVLLSPPSYISWSMAAGPVEPSARLDAAAPSKPGWLQQAQLPGGAWLRSFCALMISAAACALVLLAAVNAMVDGTPAIARK